MVDKIVIDPNYWRNGLKSFVVRQAERLKLDSPNTDWVSELSEEKAQKSLEKLEQLEILTQNSFPLD